MSDFEAEYIDVVLNREYAFGDISKTNILRIFEPRASVLGKSFKDDEARNTYLVEELRKNTFAIVDGTPFEIGKKINIFDVLGIKDGAKYQTAFKNLIDGDVDGEQDPK